MKGTEKQIKWAEDIKKGMTPEFNEMIEKFKTIIPAIKVIEYIQALDYATFWIDHRKETVQDLLMQITRGLTIRGDKYSHTAKVDQTTGIITVTWTEIVGDGKGGHFETKKEII